MDKNEEVIAILWQGWARNWTQRRQGEEEKKKFFSRVINIIK